MELVGTRKTVYVALRTLLAFVLALILGGIVFFAAGFNPVQVYKLIFLGAFGSGEAILTTLSYATPLIFTGLAFAFAQHAKVMNLARRASSMSAPWWPLSSAAICRPCPGCSSFL